MKGTQPDERCVVLKLPTLTSGTLGNSMEGTQSDDNAWCLRLSWELKVNLFLAKVESVWCMAVRHGQWQQTKPKLSTVSTLELRVVHQVSWRDLITNWELYGNLLKLSTKIQQRWMKFAVHCYWNSELVASQRAMAANPQQKEQGSTASNLCRNSS